MLQFSIDLLYLCNIKKKKLNFIFKIFPQGLTACETHLIVLLSYLLEVNISFCYLQLFTTCAFFSPIDGKEIQFAESFQ